MEPLDSRIAVLETKVDAIGSDMTEVKSDVKLLLQAKWKADGRALGVAALTSFLVTLLGLLAAFSK